MNISCILVRKGVGTVQAVRSGMQEGSKGEVVRSMRTTRTQLVSEQHRETEALGAGPLKRTVHSLAHVVQGKLVDFSKAKNHVVCLIRSL